ncbi:unnamed protein product, partial [Durusdinium trenchii]
ASARMATQERFKEARSGILFSSDVIQFGAPATREMYIHRVGRTARAGKAGDAVLILGELEQAFLAAVQDLPLQQHAKHDELKRVNELLVKATTSWLSSAPLRAAAGGAFASLLVHYKATHRVLHMQEDDAIQASSDLLLGCGLVDQPVITRRLAVMLGIEKNPLIQCAKRLGDQEELMLEVPDLSLRRADPGAEEMKNQRSREMDEDWVSITNMPMGGGFSSFQNPEIQPFFEKWGFGADMETQLWGVISEDVVFWKSVNMDHDQYRTQDSSRSQVTSESFQEMLDAFFKDREVLSVLHASTGVRVISPSKVAVQWQPMSTKVVSMSFFNKLEDAGCISSSGHIRGRLEEDWEDVPIVNMIREAMLMEESELYETFSPEDRREFLFRIFQHLVFGGASNQYEDHVEDYFKATKAVYKDLLSVRRNDTGDVEVLSTVASVESLSDGGVLYRKDSLLNFCYVIHDPVVRHVKVWYFGFRALW